MPTNSNIVSKAILRACWQDEDETGREAARPWLRWLLTRVVGMTVIPTRESDRIQASKKRWLSVRKEQGLKIDPETAEVFFEEGSARNPYGLNDFTYEEDSLWPNYFARSPGSDVWVLFEDLPKTTCDRLWARVRAEAAARERREAVARNDGLPF
jgi:hypothetical protein